MTYLNRSTTQLLGRFGHPVLPAIILLLICADAVWSQAKPNIILINLDDADAEMFELPYSDSLYPNIMQLAEEGISFTNFHATTPLCGPSRACLYRSQYAHNTGIRVNRPGYPDANGYDGGFRFYRQQGYFSDDLSVWMKQAGYRTMMVGKFLHSDVERIVPPGWDDFRHYFGGRYYDTRVFTNEDRVAGEMKVLPAGKYRTVAEMEDSVELIEQQVLRNPDQPFFLNINTLGPHRAQPSAPEMVELHMRDWWGLIRQPFSPAYDEEDVSDKGMPFSTFPPIQEKYHLHNLVHYRERALATRSIDNLVGTIRQTLEALDLAGNTYIFLTSDNGFIMGHNRAYGKGFPLDRASRVPCFVIGPNVPAGKKADHLIAHIDLGPTFVKLAGGSVPDFVDGRSFHGLLSPNGLEQFPRFRTGMLIENWASINFYNQLNVLAASTSVRFEDGLYTEWANGDREFFDLANDPEQLDNIYQLLPIHEQLVNSYWLRALRNNELSPDVRFSSVFQPDQPVVKQRAISGLAEDTFRVQQVRVAIRDNQTKQYWNGHAWQDNFSHIPARLDNPGGQLTVWELEDMPPGDGNTSGRFSAWAWAYDGSGAFSGSEPVTFHYDFTAPVIQLDGDLKNSFNESVSISGTASDDVGAKQVRFLVRERNSRMFWTGEHFQPAPAEVVVPTNGSGRFGWVGSPPEGSYTWTGVAIDESGNQSGSVSFNFEVN